MQEQLKAALDDTIPNLSKQLAAANQDKERLENELQGAKQMSETTSRRLESVRRQLGMNKNDAKQFIQVGTSTCRDRMNFTSTCDNDGEEHVGIE